MLERETPNPVRDKGTEFARTNKNDSQSIYGFCGGFYDFFQSIHRQSQGR
ncbi:hypothetical protein LguiA_033591 [Lonicera macranthoides]